MANTAHGFPYPLGTDLVKNGDDAIKALAQFCDDYLVGSAAGLIYDTGWVVQTPGTGFAHTAGYTVQARRIGSRTTIRGALNFTSGTVTNNMITVPVDMRPANNTWMGAVVLSPSKAVADLLVQSGGLIGIPSASYYTGAPAVGDIIMLSGSWLVG